MLLAFLVALSVSILYQDQLPQRGPSGAPPSMRRGLLGTAAPAMDIRSGAIEIPWQTLLSCSATATLPDTGYRTIRCRGIPSIRTCPQTWCTRTESMGVAISKYVCPAEDLSSRSQPIDQNTIPD